MRDHNDKGLTVEVRTLQGQGKRLESQVTSQASHGCEEGHDTKESQDVRMLDMTAPWRSSASRKWSQPWKTVVVSLRLASIGSCSRKPWPKREVRENGGDPNMRSRIGSISEVVGEKSAKMLLRFCRCWQQGPHTHSRTKDDTIHGIVRIPEAPGIYI